MNGLFSLDSPLAKLLSRLADLVMLNVVFVLTCLPVVTVGAAWTALYTVCYPMAQDREGKLFSTYFRAFRENFVQATLLWLLALPLLLGNLACVVLLRQQPGSVRYLAVVFGVLLTLCVVTFDMGFPLLSQFQNDNLTTLKNGLLLGLGYLPRSLVMAALNLFPFGMLLLRPDAFLGIGLLWLCLWFSAAAYLNSMLLKKVFQPYFPEENEI